MKIFISHSHKDERFALGFLELLASLGFERGDIFCSSITGQGVGAEEINQRIKEELAIAELAFIINSDSYNKSAYCLNEMGAIWILERVKGLPFYSLTLNNIDVKDLEGFINNNTRQYFINVKDIKRLIENLILKIDKRMKNHELDNTAESFVSSSLSVISKGSKEIFEYTINKEEWEFVPTNVFPSEEEYLSDKFKHSGYRFKLRYDVYSKDHIQNMRIFKSDWSGVEGALFTHPDFSNYSIDNNKDITFVEDDRRKTKVIIW